MGDILNNPLLKDALKRIERDGERLKRQQPTQREFQQAIEADRDREAAEKEATENRIHEQLFKEHIVLLQPAQWTSFDDLIGLSHDIFQRLRPRSSPEERGQYMTLMIDGLLEKEIIELEGGPSLKSIQIRCKPNS